MRSSHGSACRVRSFRGWSIPDPGSGPCFPWWPMKSGPCRGWISSLFAPVGWVWDGVEWAIGEAGGLLLRPVAWLAIAGVVYGRALAAQKIAYRPRNRYYESARSRVSALPKGVVRRAADVGNRGNAQTPSPAPSGHRASSTNACSR